MQNESSELLRNGKVRVAGRVSTRGLPKEERLRLLAERAGVLEAKALIHESNRDRAYHFMRRMYRLRNVRASLREQEATHA